MSVSGKHVMITGGSRGLGRALALELSARGARLTLVARDAGPLDAIRRAIEQSGGQVRTVQGDVADKGFVYPLVGEASAAFGAVDVLIHAASTLGPTPLRPLLDTECEDLARVLEVNLVGPFRLTKAVAAHMAVRGQGTLVAISSDAGVEHYPTWGAYGVSKAALDHLFGTFAAELADSGVRCLSIDPGEMDTDMHAQAVPDEDPATLRDPRDVARAIVGRLEASASAPEPRWVVELPPSPGEGGVHASR